MVLVQENCTAVSIAEGFIDLIKKNEILSKDVYLLFIQVLQFKQISLMQFMILIKKKKERKISWFKTWKFTMYW